MRAWAVGQIPLALLEYGRSDAVSLASRNAALVCLHGIKLCYEGATVQQLASFRGAHSFETTSVDLVLAALGAVLGPPEAPVAASDTLRACTQLVAATSCTASGKRGLGEVNAALKLLPVVAQWRSLALDPVLHVLLAVVNVTTLQEYQVCVKGVGGGGGVGGEEGC